MRYQLQDDEEMYLSLSKVVVHQAAAFGYLPL
jgi:hypothetical protein